MIKNDIEIKHPYIHVNICMLLIPLKSYIKHIYMQIQS